MHLFSLCGQQPFRSDEEGMLYDLIKTGKVTFEEDVWTTVSSSGENSKRDDVSRANPDLNLAKDLIRGMIQVNPADRMSAREILDHSWMTVILYQNRATVLFDLLLLLLYHLLFFFRAARKTWDDDRRSSS